MADPDSGTPGVDPSGGGVPAVEARLARLETRLLALRVRLARGARADSDVPPPPASSAPTWKWFEALGPIVNGVVLAVVGYFLTGAVEAGFKRQELQLSNAVEMRDLLKTLQGQTVPYEEMEASALTLAAFGAPAVAPLMSALASGGELRGPAAETGLRAIGLAEPEAVCAPLERVLRNRSGRYPWLAHLSALRLVADVECREARPIVATYQRRLAGPLDEARLGELQRTYASDPALDRSAVEFLREQLDRTREALSP